MTFEKYRSILAVFSGFVLALACSTGIASASFYSPEQLSQSFEGCLQLFPEKSLLSREIYDSRYRATHLCSDEFAVIYSKEAKAPLLVVEKLTQKKVAMAKGGKRSDNFFPDPRLKASERTSPEDYSRNPLGADRGHMFPAANASSERSMNQSFSMSNVVAQNSEFNRNAWRDIESQTRKYALRAAGPVYIYTGALFAGEIRTVGKSKAWEPSHMFKLVYDPSSRRAWAHLYENKQGVTLKKPLSYKEFVSMTGLNLLHGEGLQ